MVWPHWIVHFPLLLSLLHPISVVAIPPVIESISKTIFVPDFAHDVHIAISVHVTNHGFMKTWIVDLEYYRLEGWLCHFLRFTELSAVARYSASLTNLFPDLAEGFHYSLDSKHLLLTVNAILLLEALQG